MYAPRVFVSMTGVLIAFAVSAYFMTDSFYTAFIQTLICAVILQVGYFIGVLYLVHREKKYGEGAASPDSVSSKSARESSRRDTMRADAAPNVPASDA
jgi:exopolysaccharide production repressor protein